MSLSLNFSKFKMDLTESEVKDSERSYERKPRPLGAGLHEVVITKVEDKGPARNDPSWIKISIGYEAANKNYGYGLLLVPTESLKYGPDASLYPWRKLKNFLEALGFEITEDNIPETLSKVFSTPDKLIGCKFNVELKYTQHHGLYLEKGKILLVNKEGEPVIDADSEQIVEADYTTLENVAAELGLSYQSRPDFYGFGTPVKNDLAKFEKKVRKLTKPVEDLDDTPF